MAASNIGGKSLLALDTFDLEPVLIHTTGMTIHSWGAVTPGSTDIENQIKCIRTCKPALRRWKNVQVLIIDEGNELCLQFRILHLDCRFGQSRCSMDICSIPFRI